MAKIVRLTESDLTRIVKRVVKEQETNEFFDGPPQDLRDDMYVEKMHNELQKFIHLAISTVGKQETALILSRVIDKLNVSGPGDTHDWRSDVDLGDSVRMSRRWRENKSPNPYIGDE